MSEPSVCAICLTADRPEMTRRLSNRCSKCGQNIGVAGHSCPPPRTEKTCKACGVTLPIAEFPTQKSHNWKKYPMSVCAPCRDKRTTEWAKRNPEKRKAVWQRHAEQNREAYAEANRRYFRRHKESRMAALQRYWAANPGKREARHAVAYALRTGRLTRKPCEECGSHKRVHAHHHDYDKPLEVKWLCSLCHGKEHRAAA